MGVYLVTLLRGGGGGGGGLRHILARHIEHEHTYQHEMTWSKGSCCNYLCV